jgi:hypothetical protein
METSEDATNRSVSLERAGALNLTWQVKLKPAPRPVPGHRGYR